MEFPGRVSRARQSEEIAARKRPCKAYTSVIRADDHTTRENDQRRAPAAHIRDRIPGSKHSSFWEGELFRSDEKPLYMRTAPSDEHAAEKRFRTTTGRSGRGRRVQIHPSSV